MITAAALRHALSLVAERVIIPFGIWDKITRAQWVEVQTAQRLVWTHGFDRALAILNNQDPEAEADEASWNVLGRREIAA